MSLLLGGGVGGLCADKIPPQEFALKMQGGLCARGGGGGGGAYLGHYVHVYNICPAHPTG